MEYGYHLLAEKISIFSFCLGIVLESWLSLLHLAFITLSKQLA